MTSERMAEKFWKQGYLHVSGFFDASLMDKFNSMILEHFGMNPEWEHTDEFIKKSGAEIVPWFPMREGVMDFEKIGKLSSFQALTQEILEEGWDDLYCMSMFSKKGSKGQAWHQDCPPENAKQFNLNRLVYTHDITNEIGGQVIVVPGSHKMGEITKGETFGEIEGQVVLTPKKGDLVMLHGHCWHSVKPVVGAYRVSTNFRAMPKDTPEEITDIAVYRNMRYQFSTNEVVVER